MASINQLRNANSGAGTQDKNAAKVTIKDIPLGDIVIRENVRKDYTGIEELADSIRQHGLLQSITVYADGDQYVVKTGHRRFKAVQLLYKQDPDRFHSIRCILSDAANLAVVQLIENIQREDLSPLDLYNGLSSLREQGMTLKEIAQTMGKKESYIKYLFVGVNEVEKTPELKEAMGGSLAGQTKAIIFEDIVATRGIPDPQKRLEVLEQHGNGEISRAEMRDRVRALKKGAADDGVTTTTPTVKITASRNGLQMKLVFNDKGTAELIGGGIRHLLESNGIAVA